MPTLPQDPAPSSIGLSVEGFGTKSRSSNKLRSQSRRSSRPYIKVKLKYTLLEFHQRDILNGFLLEQDGNIQTFQVFLPTYSDNSDMQSLTSNPKASASVGDETITLTGLTGKLNPMNLIKISGSNNAYFVTTAGEPSGGEQTVTIRPRLQEDITTSTVFEVKNVLLNVTVDDESIDFDSMDTRGETSFNLIEEV